MRAGSARNLSAALHDPTHRRPAHRPPVRVATPSAVSPAATYVQVVLTRDGGGNVVGYVKDAQQFAFLDSSNDGVIDGTTLRFFKDDGSSEESAGAVARIRLFDTALSAAEVAALDRPNPAPALAPLGLVGVGGLLLAVGLRRLRRRV